MKSLARMVLAILVSLMMPAASSADGRLLDAVLKRDRNAVRQLLKNHVDVNAAQPDGSTALMLAAERHDVEIADLLIRARANVNAANEYGATALSVACAGGNLALIRLLLDAHADPNAPIRSGETPLMTAVDNGNRDAASLLLYHGADVNARETNGGQTALMWAAANRSPDIVRLLVDHGADPRARSKRGFTPLLFASQQGDVQSGRLLVQAGGDVNDRSSTDRKTALMVAAASGNSAFSVFLLEKGADPDLSDAFGESPAKLRITLKNGQTFEQRRDYATGSQKVPMTPAQIEAKFADCAAQIMSAEAGRKVYAFLDTLPAQRSLDPLWPLLRKA